MRGYRNGWDWTTDDRHFLVAIGLEEKYGKKKDW